MLPIERSTEALMVALLGALCVLIGIALRRFRTTLREERSRRIDAEQALTRTTALEALSRALSKAQTPAEVTYACLSELLPSAGAAAGAAAVVSDDGHQLAVMQSMGYADAQTATPYVVALSSKTVLTEVARRQKTLAFTSRAQRSAVIADLAVDPILEDADAAIVLPLLVSGRTIGVIVLSHAQTSTPSWDEHELLIGAVNRTSPALHRAQRFERAE